MFQGVACPPLFRRPLAPFEFRLSWGKTVGVPELRWELASRCHRDVSVSMSWQFFCFIIIEAHYRFVLSMLSFPFITNLKLHSYDLHGIQKESSRQNPDTEHSTCCKQFQFQTPRHLCGVQAKGMLPYFIALDQESQSVVLCIRGTMSLSDCLTDALFNPVSIRDWLRSESEAEAEHQPDAESSQVCIYLSHPGITLTSTQSSFPSRHCFLKYRRWTYSACYECHWPAKSFFLREV
jgi:hypothetical protein